MNREILQSILLRQICGESLDKIGELLIIKAYSTLRNILRRVSKINKYDGKIKKQIEKLRMALDAGIIHVRLLMHSNSHFEKISHWVIVQHVKNICKGSRRLFLLRCNQYFLHRSLNAPTPVELCLRPGGKGDRFSCGSLLGLSGDELVKLNRRSM